MTARLFYSIYCKSSVSFVWVDWSVEQFWLWAVNERNECWENAQLGMLRLKVKRAYFKGKQIYCDSGSMTCIWYRPNRLARRFQSNVGPIRRLPGRTNINRPRLLIVQHWRASAMRGQQLIVLCEFVLLSVSATAAATLASVVCVAWSLQHWLSPDKSCAAKGLY